VNPRHFWKMARLVRNPPSEKRVIFVFSIIAICLAVAAVEWFVGWPDALTPNSLRK